MASVGYTGIEPGIKDPRVFDKPRECYRNVVEEVTRKYFLAHLALKRLYSSFCANIMK
jgi:hypothetical protein